MSLGRAAENSQRVVSFSETPLEHIYSLFADIPYRRIRLQPYGIAFTKMVARRKGANPVWYVDMTPGRDWQIAKALDALRAEAVASSSFRNPPAARIFPFVEGIATWPAGQKEFWWEREWRHVGDFHFGLEDVALVLCSEAEHAAFEVIAGQEVHRSRLEPRADDRQARRSSGGRCDSVQWVTACAPAIRGRTGERYRGLGGEHGTG